MKSISYYQDSKFGNFIYSFGHPMKPVRINMVNELIRSYGLDKWLNIKAGKNISIEELENFHNEKQISSLFFNDYCKHSCEIERIFPKNSGADCPIRTILRCSKPSQQSQSYKQDYGYLVASRL